MSEQKNLDPAHAPQDHVDPTMLPHQVQASRCKVHQNEIKLKNLTSNAIKAIQICAILGNKGELVRKIR